MQDILHRDETKPTSSIWWRSLIEIETSTKS